MKRWSDGLPRVTATQSDQAHRLTLVYPYYESPEFFRRQVEHWRGYPAEVSRTVEAIVVDDGSPTKPASKVYPNLDFDFPVRLFRIEENVAWNWLAARNIGAHYAEPGWMLMTDMDHMVPLETLRHVVFGDLDLSVIYFFSRAEHTGEVIHPHSASFLIDRSLFWKIGGYDEDLSGVYGTDGAWRKRCLEHATFQVLEDLLIRHEYVQDASVDLPRKTPEMMEARRQRFENMPAGKVPTVLKFKYHEVTPC